MGVSPRRRNSATALVASPILAILVIAIVAQSTWALFGLAADADARDLASSIENGHRPDPAYLAQFAKGVGLDDASFGCDDSATRARLTISLAALDGATKDNDVPRLDAAEASVVASVKSRLRCNPLDGNAWLHYARVVTQSSGPVAPVVDALRLSEWSAPNESWILEPRLAFATQLYLAGVGGFEKEYHDDLSRFANYERAGRVAQAYVAAPATVQALMHPLIVAQPDARKKSILAEIDRLGVIFDASAAP